MLRRTARYTDPKVLRNLSLWYRHYLMLTPEKENTFMSTKQIKAEIKQLRKQLNSEYRQANYRLLQLTLILAIIVFIIAVMFGKITF